MLVFVGGLFTVVGLIFVAVAVLISRDARRIAGLPVVSAVELAESAPGREVLLEGQIAASARPRFREFVAYMRDEYRGNDSDGDARWVEDERVTPPLLLELPDGRIEVVNQDYRLDQPLSAWQESNVSYWDSSTGEGTKRYRGLTAGATVLVVGSVAQGQEFPGINAALLAGGTREVYLAEQRVFQLIMGGMGGLFALLGLVLLVVRLRRRWR